MRDPLVDDSGIRFDGRRLDDPEGWWNGLLYSRWQVLDVEAIRAQLSEPFRGPSVDAEAGDAARNHELAATLAMLEARYLPVVEGDWMILRGGVDKSWESYRKGFDPLAALAQLDLQPADIAADADRLLFRARSLDPTGRWSDLIRRAPRAKWESLSGGALCAMDLRVAAEMLLLFYEHLVECSAAGPLDVPQNPYLGWHFSLERLSHRPHDLDSALNRLGVSPHARAVVLVEGETEELIFRRVMTHLGLDRNPHQVRLVCLRGADKPLALPAAAAIAPILGERRSNGYDFFRPPCHPFVAVDADRRWDTPEKAEKERSKIVAEIRQVVLAQAPDADVSIFDGMVQVRRWSGERCFELVHFTDDELIAGLAATGDDSTSRPTNDVVRDRLRHARDRNKDVKSAFQNWVPEPSKVRLADALWPVLRNRIDRARSGGHDMPQIPQVAVDAYLR